MLEKILLLSATEARHEAANSLFSLFSKNILSHLKWKQYFNKYLDFSFYDKLTLVVNIGISASGPEFFKQTYPRFNSIEELLECNSAQVIFENFSPEQIYHICMKTTHSTYGDSLLSFLQSSSRPS